MDEVGVVRVLAGPCLVRSGDHVEGRAMEDEHSEVGRRANGAGEVAQCLRRAEVVGRHVRDDGAAVHRGVDARKRLTRLRARVWSRGGEGGVTG